MPNIVCKPQRGSLEIVVLTRTEIYSAQWEVDDGWVLFFHEVVLCETLVMKDNIGRQPLALEPSQLTPRFLFQRHDNISTAKYGSNARRILTCVVTPSYLASTV